MEASHESLLVESPSELGVAVLAKLAVAEQLYPTSLKDGINSSEPNEAPTLRLVETLNHSEVSTYISDSLEPTLTVVPSAKKKRPSSKNLGNLDCRLFDLYLEETNETPLLDKDGEIALAKLIEAGKTAADQLAIKGVKHTPKVKRNLQSEVRQGDEARQQFIKANLKLVVHISKNFQGRGLEGLDLIQEGNIGLFRAVDKFDWRKGFKFSTYAAWWIKQAMQVAVAEKSSTIHFPVRIIDTVIRYKNEWEKLKQAMQREPTLAEVATSMDFDVDKLEIILRAYQQEPLSIDGPVGPDSDLMFTDFLKDDNAQEAFRLSDVARLMRPIIDEILLAFDDRERTIIYMRYGFDGGEPRTLNDIGKKFGVSRERIRQIEDKIMERLRSPEVIKRLSIHDLPY